MSHAADVQIAAPAQSASFLAVLSPAEARLAAYLPPPAPSVNRRWQRAVLGGLADAALAILIILVMELRRPRLWTRAAAESALSAAVIIELPRSRASRTDTYIRSDPMSRGAESFRLLRTVLLTPLAPRSNALRAGDSAVDLTASATAAHDALVHSNGERRARPAVIDLSGVEARRTHADGSSSQSAGSSPTRDSSYAPVDGRGGSWPARFRWWGAQVVLFARVDDEDSLASVIGNTAAAIAEAGRRVVVVHAAAAGREGVAALEAAPSSRATSIPDVRVADLDLRGGQLAITAALRRLAVDADVLLIDGGSVLVEHAAAAVGPLVDSVVLSVDAGRTTRGSAQRASQVLSRLGLPVRGLVFCEVPERDLLGWRDRRHASRSLVGAGRG